MSGSNPNLRAQHSGRHATTQTAERSERAEFVARLAGLCSTCWRLAFNTLSRSIFTDSLPADGELGSKFGLNSPIVVRRRSSFSKRTCTPCSIKPRTTFRRSSRLRVSRSIAWLMTVVPFPHVADRVCKFRAMKILAQHPFRELCRTSRRRAGEAPSDRVNSRAGSQRAGRPSASLLSLWILRLWPSCVTIPEKRLYWDVILSHEQRLTGVYLRGLHSFYADEKQDPAGLTYKRQSWRTHYRLFLARFWIMACLLSAAQ